MEPFLELQTSFRRIEYLLPFTHDNEFIGITINYVTFYADFKKYLFCFYDLLFYRYVHIITPERHCLKTVTGCSISNLKRYLESAT